VKCSLIDEYVKKPSAHGTSTFNGSNVHIKLELGMLGVAKKLVKDVV
jgi:hypothetical protein